MNQNIEIPKYRKTISKIGDYEIIKTIGEGTFGKVKLAKNIPTNELVAIKILEKAKLNDKEDLNNIMKEIKFLKTFNHINIISLYEIIETEMNYYIIMEYAENELFSYIVENNYLDEETASFFFIQIIFSIEYIHKKKKIAHRDLKPENILLTNNNEIIKIIDFGLANIYKNKKNELLETSCGSPCYAAPEMILGKKYYGIDVDIWSSGIVLFAMVSGFLPFEDDDNENIYRKVVLGKFDLPDHLSFECKDLINKILIGNPKKRIKINDIKKHKFLQKGFLKMKFINFYNRYFNQVYSYDSLQIYDFVVKDMISKNLVNGKCEEDIINNIKNNNFNEITTIYKLLVKKYERDKLYNQNNNNNNNQNNINNDCDNIDINNDNNYYENNQENNNENNKENNYYENNYENNKENNDNNYDNNKINDDISNLNIDKISEEDTFTSPNKENTSNNINIYKNNITKINIVNQINENLNKNIINNEKKEKEISPYKSKINNENFIINSFSIELQKNSNRRKILKSEMNKKGNIKNEKNFIQRYKQLMNSIKYSLTNRNVRKIIDTSVSIERKNNLLFFPIPKKNILTSSNPNLTNVNNLKLSFVPSNTINLMDKSSINHSKEKKRKSVISTIKIQNNLKTHKKKSLSIITSSILTLENNINANNTIQNINSHKRAVSNFLNQNENKQSKKSYNLNKSKMKNKSKEIYLNINSSRSPNITKIKNNEKNIIFTQINNNYFSDKKLRSSFHSNQGYNLFKEKIYQKNNNNKFLITTFINLSKNSKGKNQYNKDSKNMKNKISKKKLFLNEETQKKIINKKKKNSPFSKINNNNKNNILLTLNSNKKDFAFCSSNFSNKEIIEKLNLLCEEKKYNLKKNDDYHFLINENQNSISIEISFISGKNILKMFHLNGSEKKTKEIIKNILMEIGF